MNLQVRAVGMTRFNALSQGRIRMNPDYEVMEGVAVYNLTITDPEKYNGTKYRCRASSSSRRALRVVMCSVVCVQ